MKTKMFTAILVLMAATMASQAQESPLERDMTFTHIYEAVAHDLGLDTLDLNVKVYETFNPKNMPGNDDPIAVTVKTGKKTYTIIFYFHLSGARLTEALIHELVHVSQMATGRMVVERKYILFDGVKITKEVPYMARPFEVEAITKAHELFNKYFPNEL